MATDVHTFVTALRQHATNAGVTRIRLPQIRAVFDRLDPYAMTSADTRSRLADLLTQAEAAGLLSCARARDDAADPPLPTFVTFDELRRTRQARPPVAWRDELAWAASPGRRLTDLQFDMLTAVNRWLRDGGAGRPIVPSAERSVELFNDEKAIDERRGGAGLWRPDRLTLELLRCEATVTPLVWEPAGDGDRLLLVENQATFVSAIRVLQSRTGVRFGAVGWGQGNQAASRIGYVRHLPGPPTVVEYFGDLDVEGLEMAAAITDTAAAAGGAQVVPCVPLWELLSQRGSTPSRKPPSDPTVAARLVSWLPSHLQQWAVGLLTEGRRAAQERVGFELISSDDAWSAR